MTQNPKTQDHKIGPVGAMRKLVHLRRFKRDEKGGLIVFSLFMMVCMMLAVGLAIDVVRFEITRTKLQNTLDRAVLAAADLDQTLPPSQVVADYFDKAGMSNFLVSVSVDQSMNHRTVSAQTSAQVNSMFINMVGIDSLSAPASGTANESIGDVEISLVLDNSGSMNSNNRLNLLKTAAKQFVDTVIDPDAEDQTVSISIVPFATQVNAGPNISQHLNFTNEHDYSHCVNFEGSDFQTTEILHDQELERTGHFDPWTWNKPLQNNALVCPTDTSREIMAFQHDPDTLKNRIDSFWAGGNTSIDVATKWGTALLDPRSQELIFDMIEDGDAAVEFGGRPFAYNAPGTLKVLVVMSDGQNTNQYYLEDEYRSGLSPVYRDTVNGKKSYYRNRSGSYDYKWVEYDNQWHTQPYYNWSRAEQMTWPEVFAERSLRHYAKYLKYKAYGGSWSTYYYQTYDYVGGNTKNTRTSQICQAARTSGIVVFTIGMETYGQGDATLLDCASSPAHFYDVNGVEISDAFASIARQINQLRLTH